MIETRFKDTEVGRIPEDWEEISLGDVGEVKMCKRIMKYQTSAKGDIPFYKIGTFGKSADAFISKDLYESFKSKYNYPKKGDILLSAAGTIGRTVVFNGEPSYFQDSNIVWIENDEHLLSNALLYYIYKNLSWVTESGTIPRIYNSIVKSIKFCIPVDKSEQIRIATALSKVDDLISEVGKLIEKKRAIKQGAMQQLLTGKKRLKGFTEPWVKSSIKDLYQVTRGYVLAMTKVDAHKSAKYPYPVFSSQTKDNGIAGYYSQYLYENAITWTTDGANAGDVKYRNGKFYCTNVCGVLLSDKGMANPCMAGILGLVSKSHVSYIGNPKLMNNTMADIVIYHPTNVNEQVAISEVLNKMDDELFGLEAKKAKYEQIKQGMMQQLLTGKIRFID